MAAIFHMAKKLILWRLLGQIYKWSGKSMLCINLKTTGMPHNDFSSRASTGCTCIISSQNCLSRFISYRILPGGQGCRLVIQQWLVPQAFLDWPPSSFSFISSIWFLLKQLQVISLDQNQNMKCKTFATWKKL